MTTPEDQKKDPFVEAMKYAHIGFVLPAATVAGWYLGSLLDGWLGTKSLNLVGLFVGVIAGFYDLIRTAMKMNKQ